MRKVVAFLRIIVAIEVFVDTDAAHPIYMHIYSSVTMQHLALELPVAC